MIEIQTFIFKFKKMFQANSLKLVALTLLLLVPYLIFEAYGNALGDPKCDPPCQQLSPPISGYPSYGTPPPPSGYSIYAPPPPHHHEKGQNKCPPAGGVQCCTPPAPYIYGPPNNPYNTYGPPTPYAPPNPYTYVPYGGGERSAYVVMQFLVPVLMLFSSFILF